MTKRVKCQSGLMGWQDRLQSVYTSYSEFVAFAETCGLHTRLGYTSPRKAWDDNPTVQGSTNPTDYRKVN